MIPTENPQPDSIADSKTHWPWMLVAAGFFALILLLWHPIDLIPLRVLLFVLAFFTIQFAIVFFHELAHLFAAVLFRLTPATLVIGSGPTLAEWSVRHIGFRFRSSTNQGCVIPNYGARNVTKFIYFCLFAAGPISDLVLLVISIKILLFPPHSLSAKNLFDAQVQPLLLIAAAYLFYYQVSYLFQRDSYRDGRYTDARGMADAFSYVPPPGAVQEALDRLQQQFYKAECFVAEPLPSDSEDLKTYTQWALSLARTAPQQRRELYDLFITATILYGWTANLSLADEYSRELLANDPNVITSKGSRGSVLVDLGRFEEGKSLLADVFTKSDSDLDRVISAAFIAIAEHRLGNPAAAQEWLARAITIDPSSLAVKRARTIIETCDVSGPATSSTA